jgi:hypothetical protein
VSSVELPMICNEQFSTQLHLSIKSNDSFLVKKSHSTNPVSGQLPDSGRLAPEKDAPADGGEPF